MTFHRSYHNHRGSARPTETIHSTVFYLVAYFRDLISGYHSPYLGTLNGVAPIQMSSGGKGSQPINTLEMSRVEAIQSLYKNVYICKFTSYPTDIWLWLSVDRVCASEDSPLEKALYKFVIAITALQYQSTPISLVPLTYWIRSRYLYPTQIRIWRFTLCTQ